MRSLTRLCRVASPRRVRTESSKNDARRAFVSTSTTRVDASTSDDDASTRRRSSRFSTVVVPGIVPSRGLILYPWIDFRVMNSQIEIRAQKDGDASRWATTTREGMGNDG